MDALIRIIVSWFPMIVLIAVYVFYMKKIGTPKIQTVAYMEKQNKLMEQSLEHTKRIADALENIVANFNKQASE